MVLSDKDKEAVKKILEPVQRETKILFFRSDEPSCQYCDVIEELLADLHSVNPNVVYEVLDAKGEKAKEIGVEHGPTLVFADKPNIWYMGIPSGHEFRAFLDDIVAVGKGSVDISAKAAKAIAQVNEPLEILVFVTPTCPYCPWAVKTAHTFAFVNPNIRGVMVEAIEYSDFADQYAVSAVPKIVIRDPKTRETYLEWEGAVPEEVFADYVLHALAHKRGEHSHG